jgi:hypothetical protein
LHWRSSSASNFLGTAIRILGTTDVGKKPGFKDLTGICFLYEKL